MWNEKQIKIIFDGPRSCCIDEGLKRNKGRSDNKRRAKERQHKKYCKLNFSYCFSVRICFFFFYSLLFGKWPTFFKGKIKCCHRCAAQNECMVEISFCTFDVYSTIVLDVGSQMVQKQHTSVWAQREKNMMLELVIFHFEYFLFFIFLCVCISREGLRIEKKSPLKTVNKKCFFSLIFPRDTLRNINNDRRTKLIAEWFNHGCQSRLTW